MKLVEINDVRVGQVWKNKKEMITIDSFYDDEEIQISAYNLSGKEIDMDYDDFEGMIDIDAVKQNYKLIGKLGITHRIEGNRLLEIPRSAGFQTDDVVKFKWDPRLYVINREIDFGIKKTHPDNSCFEATNDLYGSRQLVDFELKRIGILGVTHEFVNDKEVQK
uniref:hypothetical protein n=1 Tax=Candidatus Scatocola faecipullorum TaxID=2840917 RepID=UPI0040259DE8